MTTPSIVIRALGREDRAAFDCGSDALNLYFRTRISQDMKRKVTTGFVAIQEDSDEIAGFYTLSAAQVVLSDIDDDWRRRLPRYPVVPAVLLGRLAIARAFQGRKLGSVLLADAVLRSLNSDIAAAMLLVDAKDDAAAAFYEHHGMRRMPEARDRLFVPLSVMATHLGVKPA